MNPSLVIDALIMLSSGIGLTIVLTVVSLITGFAISIPLAFVRAFGRPWHSFCVLAYTYVFRGTPMLVQLFLLYCQPAHNSDPLSASNVDPLVVGERLACPALAGVAEGGPSADGWDYRL